MTPPETCLIYRQSMCQECDRNCCTDLPNVRPILMPWEVDSGRWLHVTEQLGQLHLLARKPTGGCIFYGEHGCTIYEDRPFECRIYPLLMQFEAGPGELKTLLPTLRLDPRATCYLESLKKGSDFQIDLDYDFPEGWAREFSAVQGDQA